ncbi:MAG: family 10 glycosylhydrolase [Candidatus Eisenbacteria bacterium]|nr:family 10 glycosylhydrolase [Candidatus Eisenbacteria bacterium]
MRPGTRSCGFFSFLLLLLLFLFHPSVSLSTPRARTTPGSVHERRALWVVRTTLTSPEKIEQMVREAKKANFNMLFVQVRGRGDAYYSSSIVPPPEDMNRSGFDPLSLVITRAHSAGLEVHAWVNVFLTWSKPTKPVSPDHAVNLHPEWFGAFPDGRSFVSISREELGRRSIEGLFLSPGNPDVREYIRAVVSEIVEKYAVDGIHLDYVRFPTLKSGFDEISRREFMRVYYVDPLSLETGPGAVLDYFGAPGLADLAGKWKNWQIECVTETVKGIGEVIRRERPGIVFSAAVMPDSDASRDLHGQDWVSWVRNGYLDFAVPMCYSRSSEVIERQLRKAVQSAGKDRVMAGIAVYNQHSRSAVEKIRIARRLGVLGVSLFSYDSVGERKEYLQSLRRDVFQSPASIPNSQ